jgi:hypothetical protein
MAHSFPPPRRNRTSPVEPLPEPQIPTAAQFALITKNLGIEPSHRRPYGRFADEMHYRGDIDQMIDAVSGPANALDCAKYGITANEWHAALSEALAYAAWDYKCTIPPTEAEIEVMIKPQSRCGDRACAN